MRIRTIKPEFWTDETMARLSDRARLTFLGLLNYADDEGRARANTRLVKAAIWPLHDDVSPVDIGGYLDELAVAGRIILFESNGEQFLTIPRFSDHQVINRPKASQYPPPPISDASVMAHPQVTDESVLEVEQGTGNREQGSGTGIASRKRDALFETVAEVCQIDWKNLTPSARGSLNKAVAQLRGVEAEPDDVRQRANNWPYDVPLTPPGLAKHWPSLNGRRATKQVGRTLAQAEELRRAGL